MAFTEPTQLYLGYAIGVPAAVATETTVYPLDPVIPDGEFTQPYAVNHFRNVTVTFVFDSAPGAIPSVTVWRGNEPLLANAIAVDTVTPGATETAAVWISDVPFAGILKFENTSGVDINEVWISGEVATWGSGNPIG